MAEHDHAFRVRKLLENRKVAVFLGSECTDPPEGWSHYGVGAFGDGAESSQEWTRSRGCFLLSDMSTFLEALADGHLSSPGDEMGYRP